MILSLFFLFFLVSWATFEVFRVVKYSILSLSDLYVKNQTWRFSWPRILLYRAVSQEELAFFPTKILSLIFSILVSTGLMMWICFSSRVSTTRKRSWKISTFKDSSEWAKESWYLFNRYWARLRFMAKWFDRPFYSN